MKSPLLTACLLVICIKPFESSAYERNWQRFRCDRMQIAWLACAFIFLSANCLSGLSAKAVEAPRFEDFPATRSDNGHPARLKLGKKDRMFRTRLLGASKKQPNFAGNFVLETWGCGTTCLNGAAINVANGEVIQVPFSICCAEATVDALEFRPDSRLIVFNGLRNEEEPRGTHCYEFDGHQFRFLLTTPEDGSFSPSTAQAVAAPDLGVGEPVFKVLPDWCQHGNCYTNTIEEIAPAAFAANGALFEITSQEWQSDYADRAKRRFNRTGTVYVFCSKERPAFMQRGDDGWQATFLAPDRESSYGHANEIAYSFYFAVCHGKLIDLGEQSAQLARHRGYNVEPVDAQPSFKRAEEILTYDPRAHQ